MKKTNTLLAAFLCALAPLSGQSTVTPITGDVLSIGNEEESLHGHDVEIHGQWAVIGAPFTDGPNASTGTVQGAPGEAYVYHYDNGAWTHHSTLRISKAAADLAATGNNINKDRLGWAVEINDDFIAIGAPYFTYDHNGVRRVYSGAVFIYESSVDPNSGAVSWGNAHGVFTTGGSFRQESAYIIPTADSVLTEDELDHAWFGASLALDGDGNILVGAPISSDTHFYKDGYAFLFEYDLDSNTATELQRFSAASDFESDPDKLNGNARQDRFGSSVAINYEGTLIAIGAPSYGRIYTDENDNQTYLDDAGAAFVYSRNSSTYVPFQKMQIESERQANYASTKYGHAVAVEGPTLAVGVFNGRTPSTHSDPNTAAGYVEIHKIAPTKVAEIYNPQTFPELQDFGRAVHLVDSETLLVGSTILGEVHLGTVDSNGDYVTKPRMNVFEFYSEGDLWENYSWFVPPLANDTDQSGSDDLGGGFGTSVSGTKDFVIVGAPDALNNGPQRKGYSYIVDAPIVTTSE